MSHKNKGGERKYKPLKIADSLRDINKKLLYKFGKIDYVIHAKWSEIVGDYFAEHSQPEKITSLPNPSLREEGLNQQRVLHVSVTPAAAVEFQHFQNIIIEKISSFLGYQAIHSIKIHQKVIQANTPAKIKTLSKIDKKLDHKKIEIKDATQKINDKRLEKSLFNLGITISTNEED